MVSSEEFRKALKSLEDALTATESDLSRDAAIQRFEFCVELAWKTAKKIMGTSTTAPKEVIREMAQNGYITDVGFWLDSIDKRNISSHTYNETLAIEVFEYAKKFLPNGKILLEKLSKK